VSDPEVPTLAEAAQRAHDVLNDAFGHADAPYTPPALEALTLLRAALGQREPDTPAPPNEDRYDQAVEVVLNSGLLGPHMDSFWAFVDGEITEDELRKEIP
jgi:hypothetical protein